MVKRILTGILVYITVASIGRGIVSAYGLDKWIAGMIHVVESSGNLAAIGWIVSGGVGLVCLIGWLAFRIDEKIYNLISPIPDLGSLSYLSFVSYISIHVPTQAVAVKMVVTLQNKNPALIRFNARLCGQVNGKEYIESGNTVCAFTGYAHPVDQACLILPIPDVPVHVSEGWGSVTGTLEYDLHYFYPKSGSEPRRKRRTRRKLEFYLSFAMHVDGARDAEPVTVLFLEDTGGVMAIGKYLSLSEAQKKKLLPRFIKEHPSSGDEDEFDRLLDAMARKPESADQTSDSSRQRED